MAQLEARKDVLKGQLAQGEDLKVAVHPFAEIVPDEPPDDFAVLSQPGRDGQSHSPASRRRDPTTRRQHQPPRQAPIDAACLLDALEEDDRTSCLGPGPRMTSRSRSRSLPARHNFAPDEQVLAANRFAAGGDLLLADRALALDGPSDPRGPGGKASRRSGNSSPGRSDLSQTISSSAVRLAERDVRPQVQTNATRQPAS